MKLDVTFSQLNSDFKVKLEEEKKFVTIFEGFTKVTTDIPKDYGKITYTQNRTIIVS